MSNLWLLSLYWSTKNHCIVWQSELEALDRIPKSRCIVTTAMLDHCNALHDHNWACHNSKKAGWRLTWPGSIQSTGFKGCPSSIWECSYAPGRISGWAWEAPSIVELESKSGAVQKSFLHLWVWCNLVPSQFQKINRLKKKSEYLWILYLCLWMPPSNTKRAGDGEVQDHHMSHGDKHHGSTQYHWNQGR